LIHIASTLTFLWYGFDIYNICSVLWIFLVYCEIQQQWFCKHVRSIYMRLHNILIMYVQYITYCHMYGVTIDGVWIGNRIYWALWYTHSRLHCHCLVAASNSRRSPSSVGSRTVPGLSYQLLTAAAHNDWIVAVL
jgi:hypothetical protein